jgi:hypothetical protein
MVTAAEQEITPIGREPAASLELATRDNELHGALFRLV